MVADSNQKRVNSRKEYMREYRKSKKEQGLTSIRFEAITPNQKAQLQKYWETIK